MKVFKKPEILLIILVTITTTTQAQVVCDSSVYTRKHPVLVASGSNMIFNPGFETGNFDYWKDDAFGMGYYPVPTTFAIPNPALTIASVGTTGAASVHSGIYSARINLPSNPNLDAVEIRQSLPTLTPGQRYYVNAWMRAVNATTPTVSYNVYFMDNRGKWDKQVYSSPVFHPTNAGWLHAQWYFDIPAVATIPAGAPLKWFNANLQILVEAGGIFLDDVDILAVGGEFSPVPTSVPAPQGTFYENFSGVAGSKLDINKWLVCQKQWGGTNNGVVPENLELICNAMRFHSHGSTYTGAVVGEDGIGKTRVGSAIATREYFASGRYDVVAKLAPGGTVSAFWPYHYIEDATYGFDFPNGWATIQNTEIDWEFPANTRCPSGAGSTTAITDVNCNSYGSKCDGLNLVNSPNPYDPESTGYSWREVIPAAITGGDLSANFHTYTIIWHTGDTGAGIAPSVEWLIDGVHIRTESRPHYVPYRAARFWLGVWYGKACWTGPQNHADIFMDVKSVSIIPYHEANDRYESESDPFVGYVSTPFYPVFPTGCAALPIKLLSFTGTCDQSSAKFEWITETETNNNYFTIESSDDAMNFTPVTQVKGGIKSNTLKVYNYTLYQNSAKYYRLKQTDIDAQYSYSGVIEVKCGDLNDLTIWGSDGEIQINMSNVNKKNVCLIEVYSITGQLLFTELHTLVSGENRFSLKENLSPSLYLVKVIQDKEVQTRKVLMN